MLKCFFENGNETSLRHVVVHALAVKEGKILLVKRAAHLTNPHKYGFPGGFMDRDENTEQAALRELKEETGFEGTVKALFAICDKPNRKGEDRQNVSFDFLIDVGEKVAEPDQESSEVVWLDLNTLLDSEAFAFDHYEHIELLKKYLQQPEAFQIPLLMR